MKVGNQLRPQDVLVLLKLVVWPERTPWKYIELARALRLSVSEVHSALKRSAAAGLYDPLTKRPIRSNLIEFLVHGLRYVFPPQTGSIGSGVATAHSAYPLNQKIMSAENDNYVWLHRGGKTRGISLIPIYRSVPTACLKDSKLHELLALLDAIRVGRTREKQNAVELLKERLNA